MMTAKEAYELTEKNIKQSETWKYLEERIEWNVNQGNVQMSVSFTYNPQTALLMLKNLGYKVVPEKIDVKARYFSFIISWF